MGKDKSQIKSSILSPEKKDKTRKEIFKIIALSSISTVIVEENGQKLTIKKSDPEIYKSEDIGWIKLCPKLEKAKEEDIVIEIDEELYKIQHLNLCNLISAKTKMKIMKVYVDDGEIIDWGKEIFSYIPLD